MNDKFSKNKIVWGIISLLVVAGIFAVVTNENSNNPTLGTETEKQQEQNEVVDNKITEIEMEQIIEGLNMAVLQEGTGSEIQNGSVAVVHYTGTFEDGSVFDSSVTRGVPFEFTVGAGQVIQGWDLGVVGMKVGEKRRLVIASDLAYGPLGRGPIPPSATLVFEVELLGIR